MGCQSEVVLENNLTFTVNCHDINASAGAADADSVPTYRVYEEETGTAILTGSMAKLDDANTLGFYSEQIACTAVNGFESGKMYGIYIEATVDSVKGGIPYFFNCYSTLVGGITLENNYTFYTTTHDTTADSALTDADAVPTYRVYEDETGTAILNGSMAKLDDANTTGFYSEQIACTAANGFEDGKSYTIYISATVDSIVGTISYGFTIVSSAAPTFAGITKFEILSNGKFYVEWAAGSGTITAYNIYVRNGSASVFTATYLSKSVDDGITSTIISMEGTQATFLTSGATYYCGVRAVNGTTEDSGTTTLNNLCSGSETIQRMTNTELIV